jgi:hypothetical protein
MLLIKLSEINKKGDNNSYFKGICILCIDLSRDHNLLYIRCFFPTFVAINLWLHHACSCRSQWPSSLRRGSAAFRLLGLWVQIPPEAWTSVSCEYCVVSGRVSTTGSSLVQRSPTEYGGLGCNREVSIMLTLWPTRGCCAMEKKRVCEIITWKRINAYNVLIYVISLPIRRR